MYSEMSTRLANTGGMAPATSVLKPLPRETFDPSDAEHRNALRRFLLSGKWDRLFDIPDTKNLPYDCLVSVLMHVTDGK